MKYISILVFLLSLSVCNTTKAPKEEPFTVDYRSPRVSAGEFEAQFDKIISIAGLRQVMVKVDYYPLEDAVCLQYKIDFMTYYQYWSRDGREAYLRALERYKEEFDQHLLSLKGGKKTIRRYGKVDGYLMWQASAYTKRAYGGTEIDLGYDVVTVSKRKAPFFTIFQRETIFEDEMSKNERRTAPNTPIYLTKEKADELAELFNQELLDQLVPEGVRRLNNSPLADDYF
jgi:hypothetical protein